jgi:hypothetical protein
MPVAAVKQIRCKTRLAFVAAGWPFCTRQPAASATGLGSGAAAQCGMTKLRAAHLQALTIVTQPPNVRHRRACPDEPDLLTCLPAPRRGRRDRPGDDDARGVLAAEVWGQLPFGSADEATVPDLGRRNPLKSLSPKIFRPKSIHIHFTSRIIPELFAKGHGVMIRVIVAKAGALAAGGRIPAVGDEPCEQRRQMSDRCCPYGARKDIVSARTSDRVCGDVAYLLKSQTGPHTLFPRNLTMARRGERAWR